MKRVWLIDPSQAFETSWLRSLGGNGGEASKASEASEASKASDASDALDLQHIEVHRNACLIFNHSFADYEAYFTRYETAQVPFGVIHLSDETLGDSCEYLQLSMCVFAFRNYHHPIYSHHPKVKTFGLGWKNGFTDVKALASSTLHEAWYHWCFAGALHNPKRLATLRAFQTIIPYQAISSGTTFNSSNGISIEEYRALFTQSKFALCPIGQGNIDTYRFYEALEAGCIPIVLATTPEQPYPQWGALSYWHAMFPDERDEFPWIMGASWEECATKLQAFLLHKSPNDYNALRNNARNFWAKWKKKWSTWFDEASNNLLVRNDTAAL